MLIGVCGCEDLEHQLESYDETFAVLPCPRCNEIIVWRYF